MKAGIVQIVLLFNESLVPIFSPPNVQPVEGKSLVGIMPKLMGWPDLSWLGTSEEEPVKMQLLRETDSLAVGNLVASVF